MNGYDRIARRAKKPGYAREVHPVSPDVSLGGNNVNEGVAGDLSTQQVYEGSEFTHPVSFDVYVVIRDSQIEHPFAECRLRDSEEDSPATAWFPTQLVLENNGEEIGVLQEGLLSSSEEDNGVEILDMEED